MGLNIFVDEWRFQITHRYISISDIWSHFIERVIVCVMLTLHVIFDWTSEINISHEYQGYMLCKEERTKKMPLIDTNKTRVKP